MENQIYKMGMTDGFVFEAWVCDTNEVLPYKAIKQVSITVHKKDGPQIDADFTEQELDSFIKYLSDCRTHINAFNNRDIHE
jgi:hypothetical protein